MNMIQVFKSLGPIDAKNVRRDSLLNWMMLIPVISALVIRWGLPPLTRGILTRYGFDLTPYYPVIMSYFFVLMTPLLFGVVIGMLLLDERDDRTLSALQVTPLSLNNYLVYRIATPMVLSILLMFVIYPITNVGILNLSSLLIAAIVAAPIAPIFALALASVAENKVQGFALMKASGALLMPPIFAFFVQSQWEMAFGLFPSYWPIKVYWMLEAGQPGVWLYALIGLAYQGILLTLLLRRFNKIMHQ